MVFLLCPFLYSLAKVCLASKNSSLNHPGFYFFCDNNHVPLLDFTNILVYNTISLQILLKVMNMKKSTSKDVAALAGVSQSAVSLILNNSSTVSFNIETKTRVFEAAKTLNYILPSRKLEKPSEFENIIAVFVPTLTNPYYTDLMHSIENSINEIGYKAMFCNTIRNSDMELYYLQLFDKMSVGGIIYTFLPTFQIYTESLSEKIPIVLIGEKPDNFLISSIELSHSKAGSILTKHLLDLGHKNIAFITTPIKNISLSRKQRLEGIKSKLKEHNLENNFTFLSSDNILEDDTSGPSFEYSVGCVLTKELLSSNTNITALIGVNDMTCFGILNTLHDFGYSVPQDFSVCGFDNIFASSMSSPRLTTVDHHISIRAKAAVDVILKKKNVILQGETTNIVTVNKIEYEPKLIIRSSTGYAKIK